MPQISPPVAAFHPHDDQLDPPALWHLSRANSPAVTAVVTESNRRVVLEVTYGTVARQRVLCMGPLEAVHRAERLRTRLEASGYHRTRRDRRRRAASSRLA